MAERPKTLRDCYDAFGEWLLDNQDVVLETLWAALDGAPEAVAEEDSERFAVRQPWSGVLLTRSPGCSVEIHDSGMLADLPARLKRRRKRG